MGDTPQAQTQTYSNKAVKLSRARSIRPQILANLCGMNMAADGIDSSSSFLLPRVLIMNNIFSAHSLGMKCKRLCTSTTRDESQCETPTRQLPCGPPAGPRRFQLTETSPRQWGE